MEAVIGFIIFVIFLYLLDEWEKESIIRKENKKKGKPPPIPYEPTEFVKDVCMWWTYKYGQKRQILSEVSNENLILWYRELVDLRFREEFQCYLKKSEERMFSFEQAYEEIAEEIRRRTLGNLAKKIYDTKLNLTKREPVL